MSINLLQQVQSNLGYPQLQKIDPNLQDVTPSTPDEKRMSQAVVSSSLIALYQFLKKDEGVEAALRENNSTGWVTLVWGDKASEAVKRVSQYAGYDTASVKNHMNDVMAEAIRLIRSQVPAGDKNPVKTVELLVSSERNNILPFLPASLNMGELLGDTTLDDKTNKMEGPISSLMHSIESGFSTPK